MPAQVIFAKIEKNFRLLTRNIGIEETNLSGVIHKVIIHSDIYQILT